MPSTCTLNSPGVPVKFCTSRVTVLVSPGAITRGMLASARIGARTTVSTSRLPYWSSAYTSAETRRVPLKSGTFSATRAMPLASSFTGPENRSTVCTRAVGRLACGIAASAMSPPNFNLPLLPSKLSITRL